MKIVWSASAVRQLQQSVDYIADKSQQGARNTRRRILDTVTRLALMPFSGREGRVNHTREAVVPNTAYIVVYRVTPQSVEVIGLWHASQQWPFSF